MDRHVDVLLIGGGVASVRCARALRRVGFHGTIALIGDEPDLPYNRPPLSKELLREDLPDELVHAETASWYERRGVELLLGRSVERLDPERLSVVLDDDSSITFGDALIATGAEPRSVPIPGAARAIPLRTLADARRIRAAARAGGRAVVIGGGFIGVEVASSLAARGMEVTILELGFELWGGALGPELGTWARDRLESAGVRVRTRTAASAVDRDGVHAGKTFVAAELIVVGVGVTPRTRLAADAGVEAHDGIVTNARHETSAAHLFAAGDVARVDGIRVEHWHAAREGGERAAMAMLGQAVPAPRAPWVFSEVGGHQLDVLGWAPEWDEVRRIGNGDRFALAYVVQGRVVQLAVVDGALPAEEARALVERRPSIDQVRQIR